MEFIQIIEVRSSKLDEMRALDDKWEKATEGKRTARRSIVTRDRNDPTRSASSSSSTLTSRQCNAAFGAADLR